MYREMDQGLSLEGAGVRVRYYPPATLVLPEGYPGLAGLQVCARCRGIPLARVATRSPGQSGVPNCCPVCQDRHGKDGFVLRPQRHHVTPDPLSAPLTVRTPERHTAAPPRAQGSQEQENRP